MRLPGELVKYDAIRPLNRRTSPSFICGNGLTFVRSFTNSSSLKTETMEKLVFNVIIDAPREKVWTILWGKDTYPRWTAAFMEGSNVETDWKKGSKVLFTDGKGSGMVSSITENIPNEYMSFEHHGEIKDGVEDVTSDKVKEWAGAHENYTLKTVNGKTDLTIDMDINDEFKEMFVKIWPKALDKVKELSESN
jgi:uncharacterized protein YndB with AHSA1/START domain